jgi:polyhydroxybutyrate depolymerase
MKELFKKALKIVFFTLVGILSLLVITIIFSAVIYSLVNRTNGEIISSGQKRTYLTYVPESYDASKPTPLVLSLHGFIEWPAHQMKISQWNQVADKYGFIVVYPSGTGFPLRWNASGQSPNQDVIFISNLIDKLEAEYNIDSKRIYVNGLSNGGGMSYRLACDLADRIAVFGGVAGAYNLPIEECNPGRPMPVIIFHGTDDPIVPYEGGVESRNAFLLPNIPEWVKSWAVKNGCSETPVDLSTSGEVSGIVYPDCQGNVEVIFYTIHGGGHTWPGGEPLPEFIAGHTTQDINASEEMWNFYQQYTLDGRK